MEKFAITGVAGFVAPRHLQAIKNTGSILTAAFDPSDSVGILDKYFPDCNYFREYSDFKNYLAISRKRESDKIDFVSICSPNHIHYDNIQLALSNDAHALCEKPLVLTPQNLDSLEKLETQFGKKIYTVMQLRYHSSLLNLKSSLNNPSSGVMHSVSEKKHQVSLQYITSRGKWYHNSWKGDENKSGGIAANIGIHFFDLLIWLFGNVEHYKVAQNEKSKMKGELVLKNADVTWFLSIDKNDLPEEAVIQNKTTFRSITIDGNEVEFSEGFTDLHTKVYEEILEGRGLGILDARPSIELVYKLKNLKSRG